MLERAFSSYGTTAHFWNGANPAQKTKYVELVDFFKQHATRDDEGDGGEHTEGAKDVFVVANQISKHKETANSVQQKSGLWDLGNSILTVEESEEEEFQIQLWNREFYDKINEEAKRK